MKKYAIISAMALGIIIVLAIFVFSGENNKLSSSSKQIIPIDEMTPEEVLQKMNQSNQEINKFDIDLTLSYDMEYFLPEKNIVSKMQISSSGYYDKGKKEAYTKGTIISEPQGTEEITEIEVKNGYETKKINGIIVNETRLEDREWEENMGFPTGSLDSHYIPMDGEFERLSDEIVDGIDSYVIIMRQDVQKTIRSAITVEGRDFEYQNGTGEVYVKTWIDKTDLHMVKSKSYLDISTETFSWLIDGEVLITNAS